MTGARGTRTMTTVGPLTPIMQTKKRSADRATTPPSARPATAVAYRGARSTTVVRAPPACHQPAKPRRRMRRREVNQDLRQLADEVKPEAMCITTNGFVQRNGHAVMSKGCALEAARRWPMWSRPLGDAWRHDVLRTFLLTHLRKRWREHTPATVPSHRLPGETSGGSGQRSQRREVPAPVGSTRQSRARLGDDGGPSAHHEVKP
jgi:hypothetical protein